VYTSRCYWPGYLCVWSCLCCFLSRYLRPFFITPNPKRSRAYFISLAVKMSGHRGVGAGACSRSTAFLRGWPSAWSRWSRPGATHSGGPHSEVMKCLPHRCSELIEEDTIKKCGSVSCVCLVWRGRTWELYSREQTDIELPLDWRGKTHHT